MWLQLHTFNSNCVATVYIFVLGVPRYITLGTWDYAPSLMKKKQTKTPPPTPLKKNPKPKKHTTSPKPKTTPQKTQTKYHNTYSSINSIVKMQHSQGSSHLQFI